MCGILCSLSCPRVSINKNVDKIQLDECTFCKAIRTTTDDDQDHGIRDRDDSSFLEICSRLLEFQRRRGPDLSNHQCISLQNPEVRVHLSGSVLWTQGPRPVAQPYFSEDLTRFLLYNGDIYSFDGDEECPGNGFAPGNVNDGLRLFEKLQKSLQNYPNPESVKMFTRLIGSLRGPHAFVYFDKVNRTVFFARDFFGRESLVFSYFADSHSDNELWNISSVSTFGKTFEIPCAGVFSLDLTTREVKLFLYRCHPRVDVLEKVSLFGEFLRNVGINPSFYHLEKEVISLSFSTKLKVPCDEMGTCDILVKLTEVALNGELSPIEMLVVATDILSDHVKKFLVHLRHSVHVRMEAVAPFCKGCAPGFDTSGSLCKEPLIRVLFSGGLDSTVLAYLAAEHLAEGGELELVNVAFSKTKNYSDVPDRLTAIESYHALKEIFESQGKRITLILANGTKEQVEEMRRDRVKDLISPLNSVLDDSVGSCLWFAARGHGVIKGEVYDEDVSELEPAVYFSPARIVLLGSGADELLGGYGRHRSAFEKGGWPALGLEMQKEIDRISIRNMGRDNRVVSDHGICPRMPFLDEGVVNFLTQDCDLWVKCCPLLGSRGLGEKLLLRATALTIFGMKYASLAVFPKRAMQFGSRIAKLENSKEKGGDKCDRLL